MIIPGSLGIVGADGEKFTRKGERTAQSLIRLLIQRDQPALIITGRCPKGGVDIWAEEIALEMGVPYLIFPPKTHDWKGYRARNLQIARASLRVHCIALDVGPRWYTQPWYTQPSFCKHCQSTSHIGNGGCWTMHQAEYHTLHIIKNKDRR